MKKLKKIIQGNKFLIFFIFIVLILRIFFIDINQVKGKSMEKTMSDGDRVLALKRFDINRFDIVILNSENKDKLYVKRVIGLPGDKIEYKNQKLYINNKLIDEPYIKEDAKMEDFVIEKVPENEYFVLGDNRNNSKDSRTIGFINKNDILLKVFLRIWPINKIKIM